MLSYKNTYVREEKRERETDSISLEDVLYTRRLNRHHRNETDDRIPKDIIYTEKGRVATALVAK